MTLGAIQVWFGNKDAVTKQIVLLQILYELTIVLRSMSVEAKRSKLLEAAMLSSELTHRVSSELMLSLNNQQGFSDGDLISLIDGVLTDVRFDGYSSSVWDQVIKKVDRIME